jgi:phage shock protein A
MSKSPEDVPMDAEIVEESAVALPTPMTAAEPTALVTDYTDDGVPTLDYVRDQIEGRFATSLGADELAAGTPPVVSLDEQFAARESAGKDRLEQIRRAMRGE